MGGGATYLPMGSLFVHSSKAFHWDGGRVEHFQIFGPIKGAFGAGGKRLGGGGVFTKNRAPRRPRGARWEQAGKKNSLDTSFSSPFFRMGGRLQPKNTDAHGGGNLRGTKLWGE